MRLVVIGLDAAAATERLRPFYPGYRRFGFELTVLSQVEQLTALKPEPMAIVIPTDVTGYETLTVVRHRRPNATLVASVRRLTRRAVVLCFQYGASAVVSWQESPDEAVETVWNATKGLVRSSVVSLLQQAVVAPLATDEERRWLELLASGMTIGAVAREVHRSPSDLRRRLRELYRRLDSSGLVEALLAAQRQGWLR